MITTRSLIKENPEMVRRFVKGFVAAIQYAQTHREVTLKVLSKYMRTTDADVLNASYDQYVGRVIPRVPYVSEQGLQAVIDFIASAIPRPRTSRRRILWTIGLSKNWTTAALSKRCMPNRIVMVGAKRDAELTKHACTNTRS